MKLNHSLTAALAAALMVGGVSAASAQSATFTGFTQSAGFYFYSYAVTPAPFYLFSFADFNVTGPGMISPGSFFESPVTTPTTYTFASVDGPGANEVLVASSGAKSFSLTGPTPVPAPEPSAMVSMAVLGSCLGLGIVARRRKLNASAS